MTLSFPCHALLRTLTLALLLALAACSADKTPDSQADTSLLDIKNKGVLRIGVFADNPPFGYLDSQGQHQGFDIELAKKVAAKLLGDATKIEFVITQAANRVEFLKSNKVDIIFASFSVTPERQQVVDFAEPYLKSALGIVSAKDRPITDIQQLYGQTLIVNKGSNSDSYFTRQYPEIKLLKFEQNTDAFNALKDKRGQAIAQDSTYAIAWAANNPDFSVGIPEIGNKDFIAPAVKKGHQALHNWLNQEIINLRQSGDIEAIYNRTLKPLFGDQIPAHVFLDVDA